ncbi:hypothetical protein PDESU_00286 [Pontiella desulfatans]|uniref:Uncharacterized protein n=1 Tax=Pontiella desulfatans TaxID=2750659 RepID=A0A6C2TVQ8_PONDE|nr:hypothetical protein [Pontiella desulfatans]VGO11740.1 hypothetical protein PDESU_00286 [Pontiella desulfatans]
MKNRTRIITAAIAAATLGAVSAQAVDWTGAAADGMWTNAVNWGGALPLADTANIANGDTVTYDDGNTNSIQRQYVNGGSTVNITGGKLSSTLAGNTIRELIGDGSANTGTVNQTGGFYDVGHLLAVGKSGGYGTYNLSGGTLNIGRGGNTLMGSPFGASLHVGGGESLMYITGGILKTRVGVEIDNNGTFKVDGTNATIAVGSAGSIDGNWYQEGTLSLGISSNGISQILIDDTENDGTCQALFAFGSLLDIELLDGYVPTGTNSWDVMFSEGVMYDDGMQLADASLTNDWSFAVVDTDSSGAPDTLRVTYGIGSSLPGDIPTGRTMKWNGTVDDDYNNLDNWSIYDGSTYTNEATATPYSGDIWWIGEYHNAGNPVPDCNYNGGAAVNQHSIAIGIARTATFNFNRGNLSFGNNGWNNIGGHNAGGNATLNVNGGTLGINAIRTALGGADATININGGDLTIGRGQTFDGISTSIVLGYDNKGGTGALHVASGSLITRTGMRLGNGTGIGVFSVEGTEATSIGIGSNNTGDGFWNQKSNSVLQARFATNGVTTIFIDDQDGDDDAWATFEDGAILEVDFMEGATNYTTFDLMVCEGPITDNGLKLVTSSPGEWSYGIVTNGITNILQVTVVDNDFTENGTPISWLTGYGLSAADDEVDNDVDGFLTWEEYICDTDPTDSNDLFQVTGGEQLPGGDFVITWNSSADRQYSISTNLNLVISDFAVTVSDIPGKDGSTSYTSSVPAAAAMFFEIGVTNAN